MDFEYQRDIDKDGDLQDDFKWEIPQGRPVRAPDVGPSLPMFKETLSLDITETRHSSSGSRRRKTYQVTLWSWAALLVDSLILFSVVCSLSALTAVILQMKSKVLVYQLLTQPAGWIFISSIWVIYSTSFRCIIGGTLGEWGFDLRVGLPTERPKVSYFFKVLLRSFLVAVPGVQAFSLISKLIGKDLIGSVVGVKIYSLR